MTRKKPFFSGYGSVMTIDASRIAPGTPPESFMKYRLELWARLVRTAIGLAILPIALLIFSAAWTPSPAFFDGYLSQIPFLERICPENRYRSSFSLWYCASAASMFFLLGWAIVRYPYSAVRPMAKRIVRLRDHVWLVLFSALMSLAFAKLFVFPDPLSPSACAIISKPRGHAALMLDLMTSGPVGNAIFGALLWTGCFIVWMSTFFLLLHIVARFMRVH